MKDKDPGARVAHLDALTDTPTFVWANKGAQTKLSATPYASMAPEQAAMVQLADHASLYGLSSFESAGARVASVSENAQGVKVVTLTQEAAGIEVFRQSLNVLLDRNNEMVAISGTLSRHVSSQVPAARVRFELPAHEAISLAYQDLTGTGLDASLLRRRSPKEVFDGKYSHYELASYARPLNEELVIPARVKQVLYSLPNALVPAYYVELNTGRPDSNESDYYAYVVSAADGRLLMRNNLTADAQFSYRVFADATPPYTPYDGPSGSLATPHPTGNQDNYRPPFVAPSLVTLQNVPFSQNDPWLADGATVTSGNNVDAYADLVAPDNYNDGDLRPTVTAPGEFDRTMLFDIQPNANAEQIAAATTNLFFVNNWLHDWYYDAGFNEVSGNAQNNNFGRGGLGNDAIRAQAQDYGGMNNANMSTPADGASPRMQMYVFTGRNARLTANAPASVAGNYTVGIASGFGPQLFDVTGDVVVALDEEDSTSSTRTDACTALTNAAEVAGKIAFVDRGTCSFTLKAQNAQAAGAIGVIIADNMEGLIADLGGAATGITIPALRITLADGNKLRAAAGLNVRLFRGEVTNLDGTVDNFIVAHEWGHYISNRLIGNAAGLVNNQGRAMGEGWGDFTALLMVTRPEDINVASNANWSGVYGPAEYATRGMSPDSSFFGIRRGAYSVDMTKNALSFRHIMDGVEMPKTTPFAPSGNPNAQVHNSGEVWATMLWECYVSLLRAHPFQEAQDRMKRYLVTGYKMTPVAPTFLEARDAVLSAAYANDPADGARLWAAFARRGAGVGAVAPDRYSTNHAGVVESFALGTSVEFVSIRFADSLTTPGDADGILDNGETGRLVIVAKNRGSAPASGASVTVFSPTPGVTVGNRGSAVFPEIPVGGEAEVSVPVSLSGATMAQRVDFSLALRDDGQAIPGDKTGSLAFKVNYDEVLAATPTETVEASPAKLPWGTEYDPALTADSFGVVRFTDLNRAFYGPDLGAPSDIRLITPALEVSATQPFVLTWRHAYDFEADGADYYDGAVIELTEDGGATWVDIGEPLYNGTLVPYSGNRNPLAGRNAIGGATPGFPSLLPASLDLGTRYAGKTVHIRFRIGSDNSAAATGWVLDDLSFSGITNTPFTKICANGAPCANTPPVVSAGPDVMADERTVVTLTGSAIDYDNDALTYTWAWVSGPPVLLSGINTPAVSFTAPEVISDRDLVLRLTVSDGGDTVSDTVSVRVKNVNRAPTVNAGPDGAADERGSYTLSGSASDADGDALSYLWTQVSGTPVALSNYDKASATFTTPETASGETLSFRLAVSDGKVTTTDTVDVVINNVNRAPMVTASSVTVDERSSASIEATASDADGDALTYSWAQVTGTPVVLSGVDTAKVSFSTGEVSADSVLTFRVTVSDGAATASHDVVVNVREVNRAPTVNAGLNGTVNARASYTLSGSASDADGDSLSYAWVQVSGTPVALSGANTASASFTAPETVSGETLSFILSVSDGKVTTSDTVDVVVNPVNRAPVVTAPSVTVDERSTASIEATASDADGDALTYSWAQSSGTPVVLSGADTARITFPTGEVIADSVLSFRVTVSDGRLTASHDVVVNVRNVNRAPTVNAGLDGTVNERASYTLSGSASDEDGDTLSYTWVQVSGTPVALSGANTASAAFTAPETASGETLSFRLAVSDGKVTASDMVNVVVRNVNRAPVVMASSVTVDERSTASIEATASDADGDALTYSWVQSSGTPVVLSGADTARITFSTGEVSADSVLSFRVTVSDGSATATQDVVVNVREVNRAPTVNAGLDGIVNARASYTLSGSASDADGDTLSYAWVQVSGTPVALSGGNTASATFTAPETASGETLSFVLSVNDGKVTASDTVNVVVNRVNRAPVVTASSVTVDERSTASLEATASDADGDALTYSWVQSSGTPVVLSGADTARVTFPTGEVSADSVFTFTVTVSDGEATGSHEVVVTVRNVNRAPTVNAGLDGTVNERASYTLGGSASDEDGDTLSYAWVQVSGTPVALSGGNTASASFTAPETVSGETLSFRLTVSDGQTSISDTVNVVVDPVNRVPVVTASPVTVDERSTASLEAIASDEDGDALTYSWTQLSGTPVVLAGADTARVTFATGEVSADSVFTFRVTVLDGHVTASHDVAVTVRNVNRAPVAQAGADGTVNERASYTLGGSASDEDGDTLGYTWVQVSGTPVALSGGNTASASFTAPETISGETLSFMLTVSDGKVTASDTVDVVVNPVNRTPSVTASPVTVDERSTATVVAMGSDPDGDALTYRWTHVSGPAVTLSGADTATVTFTAVEVPADRVITLRVTVSDGSATAFRDVAVTVRNVKRAPVANAGSALSVVSRASASLDGSASAASEGGTLTYQWAQVGGPWVTLAGADTATPSFTAPDVKAATELAFRLVVSDGTLTSEPSLVTVTVSPADNAAPVAKARIILSGSQASMTLDGSASSDVDGDALTYQWEQTGGSPMQLDNATQAVLSVDVPASGTYSFRLTVTDAHGASHSTTVEASATLPTNTPDQGGCSSTGAGAPAGALGLALLGLLRRRRWLN